MEFDQYSQLAQLAADFVEARDFNSAIDILERLIASDISDKDKAMMCLNLAIVYDKLDRTTEALLSYDKGISYERRHQVFFVAESKAAYLAAKGRLDESLIAYESLLHERALQESDKQRIRTNIDGIRKRQH